MATKKSGVATQMAEIRELSARQRMEFYELNKKKLHAIKVMAHVIKMGCPEHADKSIDDILDLPGQEFDKLATAILEISGLGVDAEAKAKKK